MGEIERELAERAADRERLIDLRVRGLISVEEFERRARKLDTATRDIQAMRPQPEVVLDGRAAATATVNLLAEFPYLPSQTSTRLPAGYSPRSTLRPMAAPSPGLSCAVRNT